MRKISYILNIGITIAAVVNHACVDERNTREREIEAVDIRLQVIRFDSLFVRSPLEELPELRRQYPFFFPGDDSLWLRKKTDSLQVALYQQVDSVFGDLRLERQNLRSLYQRIRYYFPERTLPPIYTLITDVDYEYRVIWTDSMVLVGLDNYLGAEHHFYRSLPRYLSLELDRSYLTADVAAALADRTIPPPSDRSFLERMIYQGKVAYLLRTLVPELETGQELHYTRDQWDWAQANEEQIWAFFLNGEHLYSTDNRLIRDFLSPAPFSKFGLELDRESPPRIGQYIGYRIVSAYAKRTEATPGELLQADAYKIFTESKYKPRRSYGNP